jgi:hypothetical protein
LKYFKSKVEVLNGTLFCARNVCLSLKITGLALLKFTVHMYAFVWFLQLAVELSIIVTSLENCQHIAFSKFLISDNFTTLHSVISQKIELFTDYLSPDEVQDQIWSYRIWGSYSNGYEEFCLLEYNTEYCGESQLAFWRNMPPSSRLKSMPSKRRAWSRQMSAYCSSDNFQLSTWHYIPEDKTLQITSFVL